MSNSKIYNIGTTVYYEGDDANQGGYGHITDTYLGEEEFTVTLEDGRVIDTVTPADFEASVVAGNHGTAEFHMVDEDPAWSEEELDLSEGWAMLLGSSGEVIEYLY